MVTKSIRLLCVIAFLLLLLGCSSASEPHARDQSSFSWSIEANQVLVCKNLHTEAGAQMYDGSIAKTAYDNTPRPGYVFVLAELTLNKQVAGAASFSWANLSLQNANGTSCKRLENDTFIESHGYPRLPGTNIVLGTKTGWICFEMQEGNITDKLNLVYEVENEKNEIPCLIDK